MSKSISGMHTLLRPSTTATPTRMKTNAIRQHQASQQQHLRPTGSILPPLMIDYDFRYMDPWSSDTVHCLALVSPATQNTGKQFVHHVKDPFATALVLPKTHVRSLFSPTHTKTNNDKKGSSQGHHHGMMEIRSSMLLSSGDRVLRHTYGNQPGRGIVSERITQKKTSDDDDACFEKEGHKNGAQANTHNDSVCIEKRILDAAYPALFAFYNESHAEHDAACWNSTFPVGIGNGKKGTKSLMRATRVPLSLCYAREIASQMRMPLVVVLSVSEDGHYDLALFRNA